MMHGSMNDKNKWAKRS